MTNDLFRDYLDGKIPSPAKARGPIELDDWQVQALVRIFHGSAEAFHAFAEQLEAAGIITAPLPREPRARALATRQRQGKGPPSSISWRGRERITNYRSQS